MKVGLRSIIPWLLGVAMVWLLVGCAQAPSPTPLVTSTPLPTIKASLMVQINENDLRWFRNVEAPKGLDAYEFTELVTKGDLKATWYPVYRSHFVQGIFGVENQGPRYWTIYVWNEGQEGWEPLPVGADLYAVKDGHVLAWVLTDTSQSPSPLPLATP